MAFEDNPQALAAISAASIKYHAKGQKYHYQLLVPHLHYNHITAASA
jgi:hypothetical protein